MKSHEIPSTPYSMSMKSHQIHLHPPISIRCRRPVSPRCASWRPRVEISWEVLEWTERTNSCTKETKGKREHTAIVKTANHL